MTFELILPFLLFSDQNDQNEMPKIQRFTNDPLCELRIRITLKKRLKSVKITFILPENRSIDLCDKHVNAV